MNENALLFAEHTWGLDVKTHLTWQRSYEKKKFISEKSLPRYKLMEQSWNEQRERAEYCYNFAKKYLSNKKYHLTATENEYYKIDVENNKIIIIDKKNKVKMNVEYKYEIIGTEKMTK